MIKKAFDAPTSSQLAHPEVSIALPIPPVRITHAPARTGVPLATLRDLHFYSRARQAANGKTIPGNGYAPAFLKLGRAVYVDVVRFSEIWRAQQNKEFRHD